MGDYIKKLQYYKDLNMTLELVYRLNFNDQSCGHIKVYENKIDESKENYEIYMELIECGMDEKGVDDRYNRFLDEIKSGKLDLSLK